jgi:hypothetical protein
MEVSGFYDLSHVISVSFLIEFMKNINMSLNIMHGLRKKIIKTFTVSYGFGSDAVIVSCSIASCRPI